MGVKSIDKPKLRIIAADIRKWLKTNKYPRKIEVSWNPDGTIVIDNLGSELTAKQLAEQASEYTYEQITKSMIRPII